MFRPEAIAHHQRAERPGPAEPLRVERWPLTLAYRGVLALLALALATLCVVEVDARIRGPFRAQGATVGATTRDIAAAFPARYAAALAPGMRLQIIDLAGCVDAAAAITHVEPPAAAPPTSVARDPVITAHAALTSRCLSPEAAGVAEVTIDSAPLLSYFFPRLRAPLARLREAL